MQQSRASQALADAFQARGAQSKLAERTKISQSRLSRLADSNGAIPKLETAMKLAADPELPIPLAWWNQPARRRRSKGKAA